MSELNIECDMFFSFLGELNIFKSMWEDSAVNCFILINNIQQCEENNNWEGFIQTMKK